MTQTEYIPSSFRDPAGFLFTREGILYRQINPSYQPAYELLMRSGLYTRLVREGLLIAHEETPETAPATSDAYRVIKPE